MAEKIVKDSQGLAKDLVNDCISRQAAIDKLEHKKDKNAKGDIGGFYNKIIQNDIDALMQLPSVQSESKKGNLPPAQSEQRWIPCSERLPEKPNVYTVTDSNDRVVRFVFTGTDSSREYWKRCAKAWMPLPEPYKEDDK